MENNNFEKQPIDFGKHPEDSLRNEGYNTCLDRTNAKGRYEAEKEIIKFWGKEEDHSRTSYLDTLDKLIMKLQTELKKAEEWK